MINPRTGVNLCIFPAFLQERREAQALVVSTVVVALTSTVSLLVGINLLTGKVHA